MIEDSDEIILVEGRADVLNLLKHGFKNAIAMNGTSCPQTIIDLSKRKEVIAFVDGDRGGNLIIKELINVGEIDFVTRAPDGKEVEELTKKELHKALRSKITIEQAKLELASVDTSESIKKPTFGRRPQYPSRSQPARKPIHQMSRPAAARPQPRPPARASVSLNSEEKTKFKTMLENLIGTKGAYILDNQLHVLGKVPFTELATTLKSLNAGIYAVVFDGAADRTIVDVASRANVKHIVAMSSAVNGARGINIVTVNDL
jgi:DNA primase